MLPAAARMRQRAEFTSTVRGGRRAAGGAALVVYCRSGPQDTVPRVGFVVGRVVGPAVVRNRLRRRLRHLMRERLAMLPRGTTLVVRANPAAASQSSARLGEHLERALRRAGAEVGELG